MPMGDRPPTSDGKRCATMGRSRAEVGKFDWGFELAWHVTWASRGTASCCARSSAGSTLTKLF